MARVVKCETCRFRQKYDSNPKSLLGRLWRWHAGWCPGWKSYMESVTPAERKRYAEKYDMKEKFGTE